MRRVALRTKNMIQRKMTSMLIPPGGRDAEDRGRALHMAKLVAKQADIHQPSDVVSADKHILLLLMKKQISTLMRWHLQSSICLMSELTLIHRSVKIHSLIQLAHMIGTRLLRVLAAIARFNVA